MSQSQTATIDAYANILREINARIAGINHCTLGRSGLESPLVLDFSYLQIRMICELVAIGCLIAHGDIKETTSSTMQREWSAEKIMNSLERLHPNFYPFPINQTHSNGSVHIDPRKTPLSKPDFLTLYRKCNDGVHRGTLKSYVKGSKTRQIDYPAITSKAQKLVDLLSNHAIFTKGGSKVILGMLNNLDTGQVQVALAENPGSGVIDFNSDGFKNHWLNIQN